MENNRNKKAVKFQGDMLNFCDFIQVYVFTTNHHLNQIKCPRANAFYNRERYLQPKSSKSATAIILIVIISIKVN